MSDNPLLLNPENITTDRVQPTAARTAPLSYEPLPDSEPSRYYHCVMPSHHMIRHDGKKLAFLFGILETRDMGDIQYLDNEIATGNPYVVNASEEQIHAFKMRMNPKQTIAEELAPAMEAELTARLRASVEARLSGMTLTEEQKAELLSSLEVPVLSDAAKIAGTDTKPADEGIQLRGAVAFQRSVVGGNRTVNALAGKKSS